MMQQEFHWIGGDLPKIGKNWAARALIETLCLRGHQPIVVDTSPGMTIGRAYAPKGHQKRDIYFDAVHPWQADGLLSIHGSPIVIKLASGSQGAFFSWLAETSLLAESPSFPSRNHTFWYVCDGSIGSLANLSIVRSQLAALQGIKVIAIYSKDFGQSADRSIILPFCLTSREAFLIDSLSSALMPLIVSPGLISGITVSRLIRFLSTAVDSIASVMLD